MPSAKRTSSNKGSCARCRTHENQPAGVARLRPSSRCRSGSATKATIPAGRTLGGTGRAGPASLYGMYSVTLCSGRAAPVTGHATAASWSSRRFSAAPSHSSVSVLTKLTYCSNSSGDSGAHGGRKAVCSVARVARGSLSRFTSASNSAGALRYAAPHTTGARLRSRASSAASWSSSALAAGSTPFVVGTSSSRASSALGLPLRRFATGEGGTWKKASASRSATSGDGALVAQACAASVARTCGGGAAPSEGRQALRCWRI
mmetsp:Transcript_6261/g.11688  ORF Transcript_6261/g.11688 Transcript_6261/m.11688 type:complete len:261 (-) Transcript_6261:79-861(-)